MKSIASGMRRSLYGLFAATALGGAVGAAIALPSAAAAPDPCAASEIARTVGSVSTNTGNYLDSHPETNAALSSAAQQPAPQAVASLKTYFDANPQVGKDMQTIQQPLTGLSGQCRLPISVPQALQLLQAAAQNGQLPGGGALPAGLTSPQGTGLTSPQGTTPSTAGTGTQPAQVPGPTGALPGPATVATQ